MCFDYKNLHCDSVTHKCICKSGFDYENSTCVQIKNKKTYNEECLSEIECLFGLGLSCINNKCHCKDISTFWNDSKCGNISDYIWSF